MALHHYREGTVSEMSIRASFQPDVEIEPHACSPGVLRGVGGWMTLPPANQFPRGTVWVCTCGRRWVSRGLIPGSTRLTAWRPQGWLSRALLWLSRRLGRG